MGTDWQKKAMPHPGTEQISGTLRRVNVAHHRTQTKTERGRGGRNKRDIYIRQPCLAAEVPWSGTSGKTCSRARGEVPDRWLGRKKGIRESSDLVLEGGGIKGGKRELKGTGETSDYPKGTGYEEESHLLAQS